MFSLFKKTDANAPLLGGSPVPKKNVYNGFVMMFISDIIGNTINQNSTNSDINLLELLKYYNFDFIKQKLSGTLLINLLILYLCRNISLHKSYQKTFLYLIQNLPDINSTKLFGSITSYNGLKYYRWDSNEELCLFISQNTYIDYIIRYSEFYTFREAMKMGARLSDKSIEYACWNTSFSVSNIEELVTNYDITLNGSVAQSDNIIKGLIDTNKCTIYLLDFLHKHGLKLEYLVHHMIDVRDFKYFKFVRDCGVDVSVITTNVKYFDIVNKYYLCGSDVDEEKKEDYGEFVNSN